MNTLTHPAAAPTPARRAASPYAVEIRLELLRLLRQPAFALPMFLLPVGTYLLFAFAVAGEAVARDPDAGRFMFAGFSVMAVTMAALFATCPKVERPLAAGTAVAVTVASRGVIIVGQ